MPKEKIRKKTVTRESADSRPHSRRWQREGGWICNKCGGHNWIGKNICRIDLDEKGKRCEGTKDKSRRVLPMQQPLNTVEAEEGSQEGSVLLFEEELPRVEEEHDRIPTDAHDNTIQKKVAAEMGNRGADSAETMSNTTRLTLDPADEELKVQAADYLKWKLEKSLEKEKLLEGYLAHQYHATNVFRELQGRELTAEEVLWQIQKKTSEKDGND